MDQVQCIKFSVLEYFGLQFVLTWCLSGGSQTSQKWLSFQATPHTWFVTDPHSIVWLQHNMYTLLFCLLSPSLLRYTADTNLPMNMTSRKDFLLKFVLFQKISMSKNNVLSIKEATLFLILTSCSKCAAAKIGTTVAGVTATSSQYKEPNAVFSAVKRSWIDNC